MRLIDADELTKDLIENKSFYPAIVKRAIEEAPTEDVVPRAEVEQAKQEVAREIFGEIDNIVYQYLNIVDYSGGNMVYDLTELGMKYIGE